MIKHFCDSCGSEIESDRPHPSTVGKLPMTIVTTSGGLKLPEVPKGLSRAFVVEVGFAYASPDERHSAQNGFAAIHELCNGCKATARSLREVSPGEGMIDNLDVDVIVEEHCEPSGLGRVLFGAEERKRSNKLPPPGSRSSAVFSRETRSVPAGAGVGRTRIDHDTGDYVETPSYRYALLRVWGQDSTNVVNFVMLNPSTADHTKNDPTLARCQERALRAGLDGFIVTNLFALRSTEPKLLTTYADPIGPHNMRLISAIAAGSRIVVCGWGKPQNRKLGLHALDVREMLLKTKIKLHALKLTDNGEPWHPLYCGYDPDKSSGGWKAWDVDKGILAA
jgi:hypothetical protein